MPLASFLLISITLLTPSLGAAQEQKIEAPYYLVEEGDSLWGISVRLGIPMEEIQSLNNLSDPNQLVIGMQLRIPAPAGVTGRIDTRTVAYGDTFQSLSRKFGISQDEFVQLNRLTSPDELIAGTTVIVPIEDEAQIADQQPELAPGENFLELAVRNNQNPWTLLLRNSSDSAIAKNHLPSAIADVEITPFPPAQGNTMQIDVDAPPGMVLGGSFAGRSLNFFSQDDGYVALQGVHTQTEPGAYPLVLEGQLADGTNFSFSQSILIRSTEYIYDPMLIVDPETVNPAVTEPEAELWASLGEPVTPEKMWEGLFVSPVPPELSECWTSFFGNRRAYNGSGYDFFHSGLDFCGRVGTELYAPAAGRIVFIDELIVRGGVVVIDHGWGVYSAYDHLSKINVKVGDVVQPGQTIGLGGETGRTTGPHLHWEVWVGGVQVDPADWLAQAYP